MFIIGNRPRNFGSKIRKNKLRNIEVSKAICIKIDVVDLSFVFDVINDTTYLVKQGNFHE